MVLDDWQLDVLRVAMVERGGRWAASEVDVLAARQNGKNGIVEVFELYAAVILGVSIIHTAHLFKTTRDSYNRLLELVQADPDVEAQLAWSVASPASGYEMRFRSGGRVLFVARSRTSGRGLSADVLVFDEAQELDDDDLAALLPTISASPNPQAWYLGSAPGPSASVWHRRRRSGRRGEGERRVFFEWSAPPDCDLDDEAAVVAANPGFPVRPTPDAVVAERSSMSDEMFARERLSVSPDVDPDDAPDVFFERWAALTDPGAPRGKRPVFGVDVGVDRLANVGVAWRRPDGLVQVMMADSGLSPLETPSRLVQLAADWKGPVMLGGPAASLDGEVRGASVMSAVEFASACGRFDDLVREGKLRHGNQPALNDSVRMARWRSFGTAGDRMFELRDGAAGPLAAVVRALHGLQSGKATPPAAPVSERVPTAARADVATMGF